MANLMEDIQLKKNHIRKYIINLKNGISTSEKEQQASLAFQKLELTPEFQQAQILFIYWSLADELSTYEFINKWSTKKTILLPVIEGDIMNAVRFTSEKKMTKGLLGIMEPISKEIYNGNIDLAIVPGIAFDSNKNRLGRGKGFYDKFLTNKNLLKIGICFDFQLLDTIPYSENDIKMDKIITPLINI